MKKVMIYPVLAFIACSVDPINPDGHCPVAETDRVKGNVIVTMDHDAWDGWDGWDSEDLSEEFEELLEDWWSFPFLWKVAAKLEDSKKQKQVMMGYSVHGTKAHLLSFDVMRSSYVRIQVESVDDWGMEGDTWEPSKFDKRFSLDRNCDLVVAMEVLGDDPTPNVELYWTSSR